MIAGLPLTYSYLGSKAAIIFVSLIQIFAIPFTWHASKEIIQLKPFREAFSVVLAIGLAFVIHG